MTLKDLVGIHLMTGVEEDVVSLLNYPTRHHVWLTSMNYDLESDIIRMVNRIEKT